MKKMWTSGARTTALTLALVATASCAQCFAADQVATGVAQLTVRNVGAMVSLIAADTSCGFAATSVLANPTISGAVGSEGTVTWTATDCALDLSDKEVSKDCQNVTTVASGKVTISASKTVAGILTGNPLNPVLPGGPDAATIIISKATFDNFKVTKSNSENILTLVEGAISAKAMPRLAVDSTTGACSISTPNVAFSDVVYEKSTINIKTPDIDEKIPVAASNLTAQNGVNGGNENALSGTITVWDAEHTLPIPGDSEGLDPEYEATAFVESFACTAVNPTLVTPVSYQCADMTPRLADGAARLTVKAFGAVAAAIAADTTCGFSATAVAGAPTFSAATGAVGDATFTVSNCTIDLATATAVSTDCNAVETRLLGSVTVSGTKVVHGRITGDPLSPVVPTADNAATVTLTISFDDATVSSSADANALLVKSGTLAGSLQPRLALATSGACEVQTGIRRFSNLVWIDGAVAVTSASGTFDLDLNTSNIGAVTGTWGSEANLLTGSVTIGSDSYTVPGDGNGLDPSFVAADYDDSWTCATGLVTPISNECSFTAPLAQGVARLSMKTLATVASIVGADTTCGFGSLAVAGAPSVSGTVGHLGSLTFTVAGCVLNFAADTALTADCSGAQVHVEGSATVSGTKTVAGWITGSPTAPVVPASDSPALLDLTISFNNFKVTTADGESALLSKSGTLSGTLQPRTALTTRGVCEQQMPVARLGDVTWNNGNLTMRSGDKSFDILVDSSALDAVNGTWGSDSNELTGTVTIGGSALPAVIDGLGLDNAFNQTAFDASWQCAPGLVLPVDNTHCSAKAALAQGAGALIIKAVGVATKMLNANTSCGFAAMSVLGAPTGSTGTPGGPGTITWSTPATGCLAHIPVDSPIATDCTGTVTHVMGDVTATTDKTVEGFLTGQPANPIVPITRTAAHFDHGALVFDSFTVYDLKLGETTPSKQITLTGTVTGLVDPVAGETSVTSTFPHVYPISTPVNGFTDIALADGHVTLLSDGKTFDFDVAGVALDAFNGSYAGQSNSISGTVTVDGEVNPLQDPRLDPAFDQAAFDATYVCTPGMLEVVPAN